MNTKALIFERRTGIFLDFVAESSPRAQFRSYRELFNRYGSSTPGQLIRAFGLCLVLILLGGSVNIISMRNREQAFTYIISKQEPLSAAASTIKSSIERSQVLMNKFTLNPAYDMNLIKQYEELINTVSVNLTNISVGDPSHTATSFVNTLAPEIARMHSITERIIRNKKVNNPIIMYELRALNKYIDQYIKPTINELYHTQMDYLSTTLKRYSKPSYSSLFLTAVAYIALFIFSFWLYANTKRIYNVYILLTFIALSIGTIWYSYVTISSSKQISHGKNEYYSEMERLSSLNQSITEVLYDEHLIIADPLNVADTIGEMDTSIKKIQNIVPLLKNGPVTIQNALKEITQNSENLIQYAYTLENASPTINLLNPTINRQAASFDFTTIDTIRDQLRNSLRAVLKNAGNYYSFVNPLYYILLFLSVIFLSLGLYSRMREYR